MMHILVCGLAVSYGVDVPMWLPLFLDPYVGYKILMKEFDSVLFYFILFLTFSSYYNQVQ
jgi:hypothetical protein